MGKEYQFSEEEIDYIVKNWGKESVHSMKKKFGCSWETIAHLAQKYGLEAPTSNEWTKEEVDLLLELSEQYHYKEIAKMMEKSENAIYLKAKKLGITLIKDRRKWTKEEEEILSDLWGTKSIEVIAKTLKRTVFSLKVKAVRMGLGPMIQNNYEVVTISDISEWLGVTRDRITIRWVKLGLKVKRKKLTNERYYYVVTWEDLLSFLKDHQEEWDATKVDEYGLGPEPEWLKEKRKKDYQEKPMWYHKWTEEEIKKAEYMIQIGKTYEEIAKEVPHSEWAIANLLRNRGYAYELPCYWKEKELEYLKENYLEKTYEEIGEYLGRTTKAVTAKAAEMGFQKVKTKKQGGGNNG